jgi:hypothetical protein
MARAFWGAAGLLPLQPEQSIGTPTIVCIGVQTGPACANDDESSGGAAA